MSNHPSQGETGQAYTELIIAMPVAVVAIAMVIQLSIDFSVRSVVQYAAFNAARAAVVQIPANVDDEPPYVMPGGGRKFESCRQAAVLSVLPVARRASGWWYDDETAAWGFGLEDVARSPGAIAAALASGYDERSDLLERYSWAYVQTDLHFERFDGERYVSAELPWGGFDFADGGDADVAAVVTYHHYRAFPVWGLFYFLGRTENLRVVTITARATLPMAGEHMRVHQE